MEGLTKKEKGLIDMDKREVIAGGREHGRTKMVMKKKIKKKVVYLQI